MTALIADPAVVGVVGPFNSSVAKVQIPISNEAGLLQCSPANTNPDLTKGDAGKELRAKNPDKINYVRVATTDDIQGPAVATYGVQKLGLKTVAIIDDTETYGKGLADAFAAEWEKLGGDRRRPRGRPEGHHRLHRDPDQVQGRQPRRRLLRRRDGDRWRPRAQADAAGRPRRQGLPRRRRHPGRPRLRRRLVHQHRRRGRGQLLQLGRRDRGVPGQGRLRREVQGRVRRGSRRLQRLRLRLRPDRAPGHQDRRLQGRRHPRGRPRRRRRIPTPPSRPSSAPSSSTRSATPTRRSSPSTRPTSRRPTASATGSSTPRSTTATRPLSRT